MKCKPFIDDFLTEAAGLLANRHKRERLKFPALPNQFEKIEAAYKAVEALWRKENSTGIAIFEDNQMIGYLIGNFISTELRSRHIWIDYAGLAISENCNEELFRDLYAQIAGKWIDYGCFDHYVLVPAGNSRLVDAWLKLGFSFEQVHALCDINIQDSEIDNLTDIQIRLAEKEDRQSIIDMADLIVSHQTEAPTWAVDLPENLPKFRKGYGEIIEDKEAKLWLAAKEDHLVGFQGYWEAKESDSNMMIPENCIELSIAGTKKEVRGLGIGKVLTQRGLSDAKRNGYQFCLSDWRMTNIQSSRFWPSRGFYPIVYRLTRKIDPRIAWANGKSFN
ncbi:GNAT family N-acetyltransferase [Cytobacillus sp. IB215316]|uniref:GNAT family N-acetyltransferase n=1 Tax=Cytobacillus sp. IB215316 TaxID=3097354 RepID=UPI002A11301A|nr:GNAT family N-acetyltransferase [Cytobacillus sp. IB215316]MDX8362970.1 GNAT family N-acetyltransferase [Cytobacillus sp. IB215316]